MGAPAARWCPRQPAWRGNHRRGRHQRLACAMLPLLLPWRAHVMPRPGRWRPSQGGPPSGQRGRCCAAKPTATYRWSAGSGAARNLDRLLDNVELSATGPSGRPRLDAGDLPSTDWQASPAAIDPGGLKQQPPGESREDVLDRRRQSGSKAGSQHSDSHSDTGSWGTAGSGDPSNRQQGSGWRGPASPPPQAPEPTAGWDEQSAAVEDGWGGDYEYRPQPNGVSNWAPTQPASGPAEGNGQAVPEEAAWEGVQGNAAAGQWPSDGYANTQQEETGSDAEGGPSPDIVDLMPDEVDQVLPLSPSPGQVQWCAGDAVATWQSIGLAVLLTLATAKVAVLAAGTCTFPLWLPMLKAASRNRAVRSKYRYVGLWQARVVELEVSRRARPRYGDGGNKAAFGAPQLRLLLGDASGARSELTVAYEHRLQGICVGEVAEMLVLARRPGFARFAALKDVYLPESGLWVAEYPYIARDAFLQISLDLERQRQAERRAAMVR